MGGQESRGPVNGMPKEWRLRDWEAKRIESHCVGGPEWESQSLEVREWVVSSGRPAVWRPSLWKA